MEYAIEMNHVTKKYQTFTLNDVSLKVPCGYVLGLVGENGAGKSTTIRLLMNAITKDCGEIRILGVDNEQKEFPQVKEEIGVVLDEVNFPEVLNANDINQIMKHTYKNWEEEVYFQYIERFRLDKKKKIKDYSRGMKMKLTISVALSHQAKLLILDEATSGLDPVVRDEILDIFNEFTRQEDHSILISSHIISDLEKICDYVAFLHEGELIFYDEKDRIRDAYGLAMLKRNQVEELDPSAIVGKRENKYGVEVLVKRELVPETMELERVGIEDMFLFFAKTNRQEEGKC